jgi:hypothetical protein
MAGDGTAFDAKQYDQKMTECAPAAARSSRSLSALNPVFGGGLAARLAPHARIAAYARGCTAGSTRLRAMT